MGQEKENKPVVRALTWVIAGILAFAVLLLVFSMGELVGQERAGFSFNWAENYHRNFGGPRTGLFNNFPDRDFTNGHGVFGTVLSIGGANLTVKGQDNVEQVVVTSSSTVVINGRSTIKVTDIKVGDTVVVIGAPNAQGQVMAKLIRVFSSPMPTTTSFFRTHEELF